MSFPDTKRTLPDLAGGDGINLANKKIDKNTQKSTMRKLLVGATVITFIALSFVGTATIMCSETAKQINDESVNIVNSEGSPRRFLSSRSSQVTYGKQLDEGFATVNKLDAVRKKTFGQEQEFATLKKELHTIHKTLATLKEELDTEDVEHPFKRLDQDFATLNAFDAKQETFANLNKEKIEVIHNALRDVQQKSNSLDEKITTITARLDAKHTALATLNKELGNKHKTFDTLKELGTKHNTVNDVEQQFKTLHQTLATLDDLLDAKRKKIAIVNRELDVKHTTLNDVTKKIKMRDQHLATLEEELDAKHNTVRDVDQQFKSLDHDLATFEEELEAKHKMVQDADQQLKRVDHIFANLNKKLHTKDKTLATLKTGELDDTHKTLMDIQRTFKRFDKQFAAHKKKLDVDHKTFATLKKLDAKHTTVTDMEQKIKKMDQHFATVDKKINGIQNELEEKKQKFGTIYRNFDALNDKLDAKLKTFATLDKERQKLATPEDKLDGKHKTVRVVDQKLAMLDQYLAILNKKLDAKHKPLATFKKEELDDVHKMLMDIQQTFNTFDYQFAPQKETLDINHNTFVTVKNNDAKHKTVREVEHKFKTLNQAFATVNERIGNQNLKELADEQQRFKTIYRNFDVLVKQIDANHMTFATLNRERDAEKQEKGDQDIAMFEEKVNAKRPVPDLGRTVSQQKDRDANEQIFNVLTMSNTLAKYNETDPKGNYRLV